LYGHKRIPGTDLYVLTHSSTPEKTKELKIVCDIVGLKKGSVKIDEVDRWGGLDGLVADLL
jgi:hypothetical protein